MFKTLTVCALLATALASSAVAQEPPSGSLPSELPLHSAIAAGDLAAVRRLLAAGADPNAQISRAGVDRQTPLSVALGAVSASSVEVVRLLLQAGADPNGTFNIFGMPGGDEPTISIAVSSPDLLRTLLEAGADPNTGWCFLQMEYTLMRLADAAELIESMALLQAAGAHRSSLELALARDPAAAALHAAVSDFDVARVKQLLEAGSNPNAALIGLAFVNGGVDRVSPLRLATGFHEEREVDVAVRLEVVRLLLAAGANANESFEFMCERRGRPTALLMAAAGGEGDMVELLLKAGADPNAGSAAFDAALVQPLIMAAGEGHTRIVQLLLDAGADPNAATEADGARFIALDVALSAERAEIVDMLRARGAVASEPAATAPNDELPRDWSAAFASCTAGARFEASNPALGASVRYEIVGPEDDGCRVSMTYESNPNPEWEGKPLLLTLDPRQGFMVEMEAGMGSCMVDEASRFRCAGPLREMLRRN